MSNSDKEQPQTYANLADCGGLPCDASYSGFGVAGEQELTEDVDQATNTSRH